MSRYAKDDVLALLGRVQGFYNMNDAIKHRQRIAVAQGQINYFGQTFGSMDEFALRLLEREHGAIITGVTLNGDNVKIRLTSGFIAADGHVYSSSETGDITLVDYVDGTTVSRLAHAVCDLVSYDLVS